MCRSCSAYPEPGGWRNVLLGFFRHLHNFFSRNPFRETLRMLVLDVDIYDVG